MGKIFKGTCGLGQKIPGGGEEATNISSKVRGVWIYYGTTQCMTML